MKAFKLIILISGLLFSTAAVAFGQWERLAISLQYDGIDYSTCSIGQYIFISPNHSSLVRMSNHGESWIELSANFPHQDLGAYSKYLQSVCSIGDYLVASFSTMWPETDSLDGIYRSSDFGESWVQMKGANSIGMRAYFLKNFGTKLLGEDGYTYRSNDSGYSWVDNGVGSAGTQTGLCGRGDTLFESTIQQGIFRTVDFGTTWVALGGKPTDDLLLGIAFDGNNILAFGSNIYESSDNGTTWNIISENSQAGMSSQAISAGGCILAGGGHADGGVFRSNDHGHTWFDASYSMPKNSIRLLMADSAYVYAVTDSVYRQPITNFSGVDSAPQPDATNQVCLRVSQDKMQLSINYCGSDETTGVSVEVYDILGRRVLRSEVSSRNTSEMTIPVGLIPAGAYVCIITTQLHTYSRLFNITR